VSAIKGGMGHLVSVVKLTRKWQPKFGDIQT